MRETHTSTQNIQTHYTHLRRKQYVKINKAKQHTKLHCLNYELNETNINTICFQTTTLKKKQKNIHTHRRKAQFVIMNNYLFT